MRRRTTLFGLLAALLVPSLVVGADPLAGQEGGPPPHVRAAVDGLMQMAAAGTPEAATRFATERLADGFRAALVAEGRLEDHVASIQRALMGRTGDISADVEPDGTLLLTFGGPAGTRLLVNIDQEGRFERLELAEGRGEQGPPGRGMAVDRHIAALEGLVGMSVEDGVRQLTESHLAEAFSRSASSELPGLVERIRDAVSAAGAIMMDEVPEGIILDLRQMAGGTRVTFRVEEEAPFGITHLEVGPIAEPESEPLTWDGVEALLQEMESEGFSGAVLAKRGGDVLFEGAYGMADRAAERPSDTDLAYGIGSTPIDFTVTLALLMAQRGTIDLDASISEYLSNVPADKQGLTPRMILDGRSGFPDFFDTGEDWDPDLAWIDRETALERLMGQELLFEPGSRDAHSHGAYVLLAALLEEVSDASYRDLVYQEILHPLDMRRTGFYGESRGLSVEDFAVGYGASAIGVPNIPPNWGPTSWLVMGSGGMFSTLQDMDRFYAAMTNDEILQGEWGERYQGRKAGVGGSDRGFFFLRVTDGTGDQFTLMSNSEARVREATLVPRVMRMVWGPPTGR